MPRVGRSRIGLKTLPKESRFPCVGAAPDRGGTVRGMPAPWGGGSVGRLLFRLATFGWRETVGGLAF